MIEKIGKPEYKAISQPSKEVIDLINVMKKQNGNISVAEIGIGIGATAVEIVKVLDNSDSYYFFSFQEDVDDLYHDLNTMDECTCKLIPIGNTHKIFDSYCWALGKLAESQKDIFDVVYLDGQHSFLHDGLAFAILEKLIRIGGVIVFDDVHWTFQKSPTANPRVNKGVGERFTDEQVNTEQVKMVIDVLVDKDKWEKIEINNSQREIYVKR